MTVKIKFDKDGNIKSIKAPLPDDGTTGRTRMSKAALELWKGNVQPTFWYKTRRFIKRMATEISARAAVFCDEESVKAVPYIGLLEDGR